MDWRQAGSLHPIERAQEEHSGFVCVSRLIIGKLMRLDTDSLEFFFYFLKKGTDAFGSKSRAFRWDMSTGVVV